MLYNDRLVAPSDTALGVVVGDVLAAARPRRENIRPALGGSNRRRLAIAGHARKSQINAGSC